MLAWMLKVKKFIFIAALLMPASFLLTCDNNISPNAYDPPEFERPSNANSESYSVTVYLDGSPPVFYSRALTKEYAVYGHDYFEVAFVRPVSGGQIIARASWERGHAAGVSGVARGFDYQYTNVTDAATNNGGAALLFVGKRSDRTLLGVGKLTGTDDPANGGATYISANTKSVTFTVTALKAGVGKTAPFNSFQTSESPGMSPLNTSIIDIFLGDRIFPLYNIDKQAQGITTYAQYSINVGGFEEGILRSGAITNTNPDGSPPLPPPPPGFIHLSPRYPRGNGTHITPTTFTFDNNTVVLPENNTSGTAFENPVRFSLNTTGTVDGSVFAFAFQIPVYPLTDNDGRPSADPWYIRPGFDSYLYDLDDGRGGTGGAVLIGTGNIDQSLVYNLYVHKPPYKQRYFDDEDSGTTNDWIFEVDQIVIYLRVGTSPLFNLSPDSADSRKNNIRYYIRTTDTVPVEIDLTPNVTDLQQYFSRTDIYNSIPGTMIVFVEYTGSDFPDLEPGGFPVYAWTPGQGGLPGASEIPYENRIAISNPADLNDLQNAVLYPPGNYLLLFYDNQDFPPINLNGVYTFVMLAARPGLQIGKASNTGGFVNHINGSNFYFGVWPYNEDLIIGGRNIGNGYTYELNTTGTWQTMYASPAEFPGSYFIQHSSTFTSLVTTGPGVQVYSNGVVSSANLEQP
jgi:hypothetical protein